MLAKAPNLKAFCVYFQILEIKVQNFKVLNRKVLEFHNEKFTFDPYFECCCNKKRLIATESDSIRRVPISLFNNVVKV